MKKSILVFGISAFTLTACANPIVAEPVKPQEYEMNCQQLDAEIRKADELRVAARADDRADPKYLLIFNAFVSAYRMNKAEAAAEKRLTDLKRIAEDKQCGVPNLTQPLPPAGAPIIERNKQVPAQVAPIQATPQAKPVPAAPQQSTTRKVPVAKSSY